jgi:hypothetical protein
MKANESGVLFELPEDGRRALASIREKAERLSREAEAACKAFLELNDDEDVDWAAHALLLVCGEGLFRVREWGEAAAELRRVCGGAMKATAITEAVYKAGVALATRAEQARDALEELRRAERRELGGKLFF